MTEQLITHLASSIIWWLNYKSSVGRNYLFSEGSIKYPAAECLESLSEAEIKLEYSHPNLYMRRLDMLVESEDEEHAFEFKFINGSSTRSNSERKRIFNDLMRLKLFLEENRNGYFLICGKQDDFTHSFKKLVEDTDSYIDDYTYDTQPSNEASGFYNEWFSFDNNDPKREIGLHNAEENYETIYHDFINDYSKSYEKYASDELSLPNSLTTNLIFLSSDLPRSNLPNAYKIGIWEILQ